MLHLSNIQKPIGGSLAATSSWEYHSRSVIFPLKNGITMARLRSVNQQEKS